MRERARKQSLADLSRSETRHTFRTHCVAVRIDSRPGATPGVGHLLVCAGARPLGLTYAPARARAFFARRLGFEVAWSPPETC